LRPKSGDIVFLPNSPGSTDGLVLQVLSSSEVAVFEGIVSDDALALDVVRSKKAKRLPSAVNKLFRSGRFLGNAPLRKDLKGRKLYAEECGAHDAYLLSTANGGSMKTVSYDEAQSFDRLHFHDAAALQTVALGESAAQRFEERSAELSADRVRSPAERKAARLEQNSERWAERRRQTTPGPFGDAAALEGLIRWIEDYGIENAVQRFHDLAVGIQGYGRPCEREERRPYAFAGMVAIWSGKKVPEGWPAELANRFPSAPSEQLLTKALRSARLLVDRVISSDAEMCFIWDGAPDGGAALRNSVESLKQALA
jgi:hypothetical protein